MSPAGVELRRAVRVSNPKGEVKIYGFSLRSWHCQKDRYTAVLRLGPTPHAYNIQDEQVFVR